ncbi:MAG: tRNA (N(6)-L-threonylcarbamoyladenosine(37)-C(2))-methylthiotransferase MtaB [Candidatus Omnitrophica bacterium]|nr:tRNA (N(6)-L-threonylcarbamoyladenosine(37)-C(2))-methylthiotransferase MtaB [Candidatus Omnitrophota bacterium]
MNVKFITLGCKVNQYETQALIEEFVNDGFHITQEKADIYVINTCAVTHRAEAKSKEAIARVKKENPQAKIVVCGCMVNSNKELLSNLDVDYLIPQDIKYNLVDIITNREIRKRSIWDLKISRFFNQRAFVKIQDGCDYNCSFCEIPFIRGRAQSRRKEEIIAEVKRLSYNYREIVLCGVNLGLYGKDLGNSYNLVNLIEEILEGDNLGRLRLSSLEPGLVGDDLLKLFVHPKLCPHIHLPFQSGDDRVLKFMNKRENVSLYYRIVDNVRKINPHIAISCDIMLGFPYEDEDSFKNTLEFLNKVKPMRIHIFTFSPRPHTPFANYNINNYRVIKERQDILKRLANEFNLSYKQKFLNQRLEMIAENKDDGYVCGYTSNYIKVWVEGKLRVGEVYPVVIKKIEPLRVIAGI